MLRLHTARPDQAKPRRGQARQQPAPALRPPGHRVRSTSPIYCKWGMLQLRLRLRMLNSCCT